MQPVPKPLDRAPSEVTCSNPFLEDGWIPSHIHCVQKQSITISALYFSNVVWVILVRKADSTQERKIRKEY